MKFFTWRTWNVSVKVLKKGPKKKAEPFDFLKSYTALPDLSLGFPFPDLMRHQHFKISIFFFTFFSERAHLQ